MARDLPHAQAGVADLDLRAGVGQLREQQLEVLRPGVVDRDVAERRDRSRRPGAHLDAVGHCGVFGAVKLVDALHLDRARSGAVDLSAHRREEQREVCDLGLARRVVDHRRAPRDHRCEQEVLGRGDARVVQRDRGTAERRGVRDEVSMFGPEGRAHALETAHVQVDRAGADVVAARQRHPRTAAPREQRPEHHDRRAHLPRELVRRLEPGNRGRVELGDAVCETYRDADMLEHLGHDRAVADARQESG